MHACVCNQGRTTHYTPYYTRPWLYPVLCQPVFHPYIDLLRNLFIDLLLYAYIIILKARVYLHVYCSLWLMLM